MAERPPFSAARDVPPLLLRIGLAFIALTLPLGLLPRDPLPLWWVAIPLALGLFTRAFATLAVLGFATTAFAYLGDIPTFIAVFALAGVARILYVEGPGALAVDPLPLRAWLRLGPPGKAAALGAAGFARQRTFYADYRAYTYRMPLAFILLTAGLLFLLRGTVLVQALGVAWLAVGLAIAIGFLTPWAAVVAAFAFPLAAPATGQWFWLGLGLCVLALAFVEDDRVSLDRRLRRRGGLFPTMRREVVLEPLRR